VAGAAYGAALAGWRSPQLALYVAIKFPILLFGTTALVVCFNIVTFQMTTLLRPILTAPAENWWTAEKKFFMVHFADSFAKRK